ncbi:hypothetical protein M409DRAFT_71191 [Zasmidium cellare ATCC 36951]|uniref:Uncharacterized protein n=1 Tax=Zasmidium cellare ATCC 36951 TaxID=1080233 RepID=A0A6A6C0F5_ZASCE|nr:uncharacterized protein M409DRAFT_71191 [Zasmidium cellare ATCC 36951]KAF2159186.1 hypothetical protein M409DRAFT_71191 [Zasmidium cellare ATCC 36951]
MLYSNILALGAATLAAAAPVAENTQDYAFNVTNFVFGCTTGCYWYLDVSVEGEGPHHPAVNTPVHCEGGLDEDTDYVQCGNVSDTQAIYAYIVKDTNELNLQYEVQYPEETAVYRYYGQQTVYAATSDQADLQEPNFKVLETETTGVA